MNIRNAEEGDYNYLAALFKKFFTTHNRFQKSDEEIVSYLKKQSQENELLVYDHGGMQGALFLVNFGQSTDHKLWKFRHFAFNDENVGKELLEEAEKRVREASKTAKIELTIAESEGEKEFYIENGYVEEGTLSNHYRWGETCFVLSKSFG